MELRALELPIDDSWLRDSGPVFVANGRGELALVQFGFNGWGERFHPYDLDAKLPKHLADHLGCRRYEAPFVLEGGSYLVDGERTLLTTEGCLLNPNRNPAIDRAAIEDGLRRFLGVETIVWLPFGMAEDRDTDGHVDGVAQYVEPGRVALLVASDPANPCNGAAIVPVAGVPDDQRALAELRALWPDRQIVPVPGTVLSFGGGGPHCITQQVPAGSFVTRGARSIPERVARPVPTSGRAARLTGEIPAGGVR